MFSYDEIQKYNETDMLIYRYIISNAEKVPYMTIRELAGEIHTSPGAVLFQKQLPGIRRTEGSPEAAEPDSAEKSALIRSAGAFRLF